MKTQNLSCEAKVEIISNKNAILLVDKKDVTDESIDFKYNDNVATLVAKNTANAKMGDVVKLNIQKKNLDLFIKIMYFAPLVFLLFVCAKIFVSYLSTCFCCKFISCWNIDFSHCDWNSWSNKQTKI